MSKEDDAVKFLLRVSIRAGKIKLAERGARTPAFPVVQRVVNWEKNKREKDETVGRLRRRAALLLTDPQVINTIYDEYIQLKPTKPFSDFVRERLKIRWGV